MRAVIYARFSSDQQRPQSIEDQIRLCKAKIDKEGWNLVTSYTDRALSGSIRLRPGYQTLLEDARSGEFDILVAEALDRLSRDQEDIAALYKHMSFSGIRLVTIGEGEINELHVGLNGTMNALFLKDLRIKVKRGLEGRVRQGRSGGGLCFGYDVILEQDARGEPVLGARKINEVEAAVVRRIFQRLRRAAHRGQLLSSSMQTGLPDLGEKPGDPRRSMAIGVAAPEY
jgi:DNA invertase Pin-like site-specific DNA recombinase